MDKRTKELFRGISEDLFVLEYSVKSCMDMVKSLRKRVSLLESYSLESLNCNILEKKEPPADESETAL